MTIRALRGYLLPLLFFGAIGLVFALVKFAGLGDRSPRRRSGTYVSEERWQRPPGTAEEMSQTLGVSELIERWKAVPENRSKWGMHAEYARALGLVGAGDPEAVAALAPFAVHEDPTLRKAAAEALSAIGAQGLPPLLEALAYGGLADSAAGDIRWDAAIAISHMGPAAEEAIPALMERIMNWEEHVLVRQDAVAALGSIGEPALDALKEAREAFYARSQSSGLTVTETAILRQINLALSGQRPSEEGEEKGEEADKEQGEEGE